MRWRGCSPACWATPSHQYDSFSDGLLDCPHYSRPEVLDAPDGPLAVPKVLLSGHHAEIARWRREQASAHHCTAPARPDRRGARAGRLEPADEALLRTLGL